MCYEKNLKSLNTLTEIAMRLNNKIYELAIKTYYTKIKDKTRLYFR